MSGPPIPGDSAVVVIARRITRLLEPGYTRGFRCRICGAELEVSDDTLAITRRPGALVLCNACGFELTRRATKDKSGRAMELRIMPEALEHIRDALPNVIHCLGKPDVTWSVDSRGHVLTHMDFRSKQPPPDRPMSIPCDFCLSPSDRLWCWLVLPVCAILAAGGRTEFDGGQWRACVYCQPLVAARDWQALAARVQILNPALAEVPTKALIRQWSAMFTALADPQAEPTLWNAGEPFPGVEKERGWVHADPS